MTEVGVHRTSRDYQIVIAHITELRLKNFFFNIDAAHFFHQNGGIALGAQNVPDRPGDIRGRQCRSGHLIKQWLEAMVIMPVDNHHFGRARSQRFGGFQTAKARPDDYDPCIADGTAVLSVQMAQCPHMDGRLPSLRRGFSNP